MQFAHDNVLRWLGEPFLPLPRRMNAIALTIGALMTAVLLGGCSTKPEVVRTETKQEQGGITLVTVTVACHGEGAAKCESEGLLGITRACPSSPQRSEVRVTKTPETVEMQWRCAPPK